MTRVKRRILAMGIVAALLVGCGVSPASALATQGDETGVLVTDELSDYENGEVFVVYWDGHRRPGGVGAL
jgi:hypothetical protein